MVTPHASCVAVNVADATLVPVAESATEQTAYLATVASDRLDLTYGFRASGTGATYPDPIFDYRPSRYTRFADDLVQEVGQIAPDLAGIDRIAAIACATAERFTYGHPEARFNDGFDEVPALGCGLTEGSCVDINTYFIASLRAAGFEAGYVTGFFFPEEKNGHCTDGHCWVVTRVEGRTQEWDIAHHLKLGTRDIRPGLNPKPGFRAACFHSMGLSFPEIGVAELKALIEPLVVVDGWTQRVEAPEIRLIPRG